MKRVYKRCRVVRRKEERKGYYLKPTSKQSRTSHRERQQNWALGETAKMQVSMMDLVLGLPASLKCPHRKHSTSAAGMGPCRQGDTLYLCLGTAARANSLELPHVLTWGRSDSHPASLKYENSESKMKLIYWKRKKWREVLTLLLTDKASGLDVEFSQWVSFISLVPGKELRILNLLLRKSFFNGKILKG